MSQQVVPTLLLLLLMLLFHPAITLMSQIQGLRRLWGDSADAMCVQREIHSLPQGEQRELAPVLLALGAARGLWALQLIPPLVQLYQWLHTSLAHTITVAEAEELSMGALFQRLV